MARKDSLFLQVICIPGLARSPPGNAFRVVETPSADDAGFILLATVTFLTVVARRVQRHLGQRERRRNVRCLQWNIGLVSSSLINYRN